MTKLKKIRTPAYRNKWIVLLGIFIFAVIGTTALLISRAATAVVIDASLPVPTNVKAYGDDQNIVVRWDPVPGQQGARDTRVVGYYITYRPKGSSEPYKVRQQQVSRDQYVDYATAIQLQPLQNGVEYEINVQSAAGTFQSKQNGGIVTSGQGSSSSFAVANGKVSNKATAYATTSSARVDAMRQRLTGFFDDFNQPAGPFDELKWNTATTSCVVPGTASAFINNQFHAHNQIRSLCDRGGIASRPRATFDTTGATEANPAVLEFDVDGASQLRDTWYIDLIPLNSRPATRLPMDITSHNDAADTDHNDPGNNIRINARRDALLVNYYDVNKNPTSLNPFTEDIACDSWNGKSEISYNACDTSIKTPGLSPLPYPSFGLEPLPNVRRHWVVKITPTKLRIYIDGVFVSSVNLPSQFAAQKQFTVHSTVFSYNTAKQYHQVTPYVQLLHWDNFGFSGPAPTEIIHNYLEGGPTGDKPVFSTSNGGGYSIPEGNRTTVIAVPDQIGTLKDGKARLFFTMQDFTAGTWFDYVWKSTDHVVVNGKSYPFPDPRLNMLNPYSNTGELVQGYIPLAMQIPINQADIKQGNNEIKFNVNSSVLNVHLELPYVAGSANIPSYTQPLQIFGNSYRSIVEPPFTTCDQYWFVERDLGLQYEAGKINLVTSPCTFMPSHNHDITHPPTTPTNPTNQSPTVTITPSTTSATAPATFYVVANASDADGTVSKIEIRKDGSAVKTCTNVATCTFDVTGAAKGNYSYSAVATDNLSATGSSATTTIIVADPTPPPVSNKFVTLGVNATLPSETECASRVRSAVETRPANQVPNHTKGSGGSYLDARITGNYMGTTDEIIQWAACKWGMDEDTLRAQMVQESYWHQNAIGDFSTDGNACSPVYPVNTYPSQYNGDATHTNQCPESYGLSQVRWTYHKSAFYSSATENSQTITNNAIYSTAYNADYWASRWRNCYNGNEGWLNQFERGKDYVSGDEWGCLGLWFSGRWYTAPAQQYIDNVKNNLNGRVWETTAFKNSQPVNTIPSAPSNPTDTTAPTVSLTAPASNATVSNTVTVTSNASDAVGVTRVSYFLDGSNTAFSNDSVSPYSSSWNTATVSNGAHTIVAKAYDAAGNVGVSATLTLNVNNVVPDTTAPTVSLTAPANNAVIKNTITISATASDNVGVSKVELFIDGQQVATDLMSPYRFQLDTSLLSEANHTIQMRAYDAAGNNAYSSTVAVTVDNIVMPPPTCQDENANNKGQSLPCTYDPTQPEPPKIPKPGDVNGDGVLDRDDLRIFLYYYVRRGGSVTNGDVNGDGVLDRDDLRIFLYYYVRK